VGDQWRGGQGSGGANHRLGDLSFDGSARVQGHPLLDPTIEYIHTLPFFKFLLNVICKVLCEVLLRSQFPLAPLGLN
jgi:hypothetical protein